MGVIFSTLCCQEQFKYEKVNVSESQELVNLKYSLGNISSESLFIVNGVFSNYENNYKHTYDSDSYNLSKFEETLDNSSSKIKNGGTNGTSGTDGTGDIEMRKMNTFIIPEMFITLGDFGIKITDMELDQGLVYCLIGGNKSGKSVFCKTLAGILKPDNHEFSPDVLIGYKPQYINRCKYTGTVYNFLRTYVKNFREKYHQIRGIFNLKEKSNSLGKIDKICKNGKSNDSDELIDSLTKFEIFKQCVLIPFDIPYMYNKNISELSEYEWIILSIISTIGNLDLNVYIIDEFVWLTKQERGKIAKVLKEFAKQFDKTVIIVETDRTIYLDYYDNFINIKNHGELYIAAL
jgi:translation initiation factor RLI1